MLVKFWNNRNNSLLVVIQNGIVPLGDGRAGLPRWHRGKNLPASVGDNRDMGLIPGLGRSPGLENDTALQCSGLENAMGWRATVYGVTRSQTQLNS